MSWYSPKPKQKPIRLPRRRPIKTVPSGIGDQGIVGNWLFYYLKGGDHLHDFSPYGNHGTLKNNPTWKDGRYGWGLDFDGVDDYVEVPDPATDLSDAFTVVCWVKLKSGADGEYCPMVEKNGVDKPNYSAPFDIRTSDGGFPKDLDCMYGNSSTLNNLGATDVFEQDKWYHIVIKADSTNGGIAYINGSQVDSNTSTTFADEDQVIMFAQRLDDLNYAAIDLAIVRIYSVVKSASWIKRRYERTKGIFK